MRKTHKNEIPLEDKVDKKLVAGLLSIVLVATFTSWVLLIKANDWQATPDYQTGLATAGSDVGFLSSVLAGAIALFAVIGFGAAISGEKRGVSSVTWTSLLLLITTVAVPTIFVGLKYETVKAAEVETKTIHALNTMMENNTVVGIEKLSGDYSTKMVLNTQTCDYYISETKPGTEEQIIMAGNNQGTFSLTNKNMFVYTEGNWSRQFWQDIPVYPYEDTKEGCTNITQIGTYLNTDGSINSAAVAQETLKKDTTPTLLVFWQGIPELTALNTNSAYSPDKGILLEQPNPLTGQEISQNSLTLNINKGWDNTKYVFKPVKNQKLIKVLEQLRLGQNPTIT